ncbi:hypothetical protein ISCGN_013391 [Ixodes scapularis]
MFTPFAGKWTQILGFFGSHRNVTAEVLIKILLEATALTEGAGLFVELITCDGAAWNRKMWRLMGVGATTAKVTCKVPHTVDSNRSLHFLSDFSHLLKCLRNTLRKAPFKTPDGKIMIDHLRQAFRVDSNNITLKAMPYITSSHLTPNSFELMRVSLAFQLFGPHVLRAFHLYKPQIGRVYPSIDATQAFIRKVGDLIAIMTSRFSTKALRADSWRAERLFKFLQYLTDWEELAQAQGGKGFLSKSTADGLRVTISMTLSLLTYVTKELGYHYLLTARLSQHCIENLFGIVRQSSGCNDHPTPVPFLVSVNCLSFCNIARSVTGGNVVNGVLSSLLRASDQPSATENRRELVDQLITSEDLQAGKKCISKAAIIKEHGYMTHKSDARLYTVTVVFLHERQPLWSSARVEHQAARAVFAVPTV